MIFFLIQKKNCFPQSFHITRRKTQVATYTINTLQFRRNKKEAMNMPYIFIGIEYTM